MLIEFRVENHRSLCNEQVMTLEASRAGAPGDERPRDVGEQHLLPVAALYGANASGKSNVLNALAYMREAVLISHRIWEPDSGVPRSPFAWGEARTKPSLFEVKFLVGVTKYCYGFVVNDDCVEEEWLYAWPSGRKQTWFERDHQEFKFGDNLKGENRIIQDITGSNALYLSAASQHRHEQLFPVYSWFRDIAVTKIRSLLSHSPPWYFHLARLFGDEDNERPDTDLRTRFCRLLRASDTGIVDVKALPSDEDESPRSRRRMRRFVLQHQEDDDDSWLPLDEESRGTQTLIHMTLPILETLRRGGLILIDELEGSLHPLLAIEIIRLFNDRRTNPSNAQLIFTTHDTNLLGTTMGEPVLRRDQIWLTEKDSKGSSVIYPLTNYKPRKAENLERGYLQGRYSAIPFLGDISRVVG